jgi:hypothetical protein
MIVAYNSTPGNMGFYVPQYMGAFNINSAIKASLKQVQNTVDKVKTQVVKAQQKKEQQKKIVPIVMIAGAGIAGILIFKKMGKGKKTK